MVYEVWKLPKQSQRYPDVDWHFSTVNSNPTTDEASSYIDRGTEMGLHVPDIKLFCVSQQSFVTIQT